MSYYCCEGCCLTPMVFLENMWLWCSSRLFPCSFLFLKNEGCFTPRYHNLSNSWLLWMSNISHNLKKRLGARKLCGYPNLFWERFGFGSKQTIYSFLQIFARLTCKNGLVIQFIFGTKILFIWSKFVGYFQFSLSVIHTKKVV